MGEEKYEAELEAFLDSMQPKFRNKVLQIVEELRELEYIKGKKFMVSQIEILARDNK